MSPNRNWKAEMDARTLSEAEVIKSTPGRLKQARGAAKKLVAEERKEASAMSKVATGKTGNPSGKKPTPKRKKKPIGYIPKLGEVY